MTFLRHKIFRGLTVLSIPEKVQSDIKVNNFLKVVLWMQDTNSLVCIRRTIREVQHGQPCVCSYPFTQSLYLLPISKIEIDEKILSDASLLNVKLLNRFFLAPTLR